MAGTGALQATARLKGRRQVLLCVLFCLLCGAVSGQKQYTIPEEMQRGAIVGNIALDLGLNVKHLSDRQLRVVSDAGYEYFTLNAETGTLHVNGRIDREEMCGESPSCSVTFEAIAQNPLTVFHVEVLIQDINDNAPSFLKNFVDFDIAETSLPGVRFALGNAQDPDIGINSLQGYELSTNPHFVLEEKESSDGYKSAELVLQRALDRETQSHHHLTLTASDGGEPIRTSTVAININVLDANDNFPVFSQESYRASISEGAPNNTVVLQVKAIDKDEGLYSKITYSFSSTSDKAMNTFNLDVNSGEIKVKKLLDYEKTNSYKMSVEAKDGGGLVAHCRVFIDIIDDNDNAPEITFASITSPIPENSPVGTVVALIHIQDADSGDNGKVVNHIPEYLPFKLISSSGKYCKIVTSSVLDRETVSEYNITVSATDHGSSPLITSKTILLQLSDVNDNAPVFDKSSYYLYVPENNTPGISLYKLKAADLDLDNNARISYLPTNHMDDVLVSSYISINSQTGVIYAQCSYDYEQVKQFQFQVKAQDAGSPPLSSNVTVRVFIVDQNDNPPKILYPPLGSDGSSLFEMVPPSSSQEYLVTKVVAVDADSGHNAWLSYHLLQGPGSALFKIGLHTGEIRTTGVLLEKDSPKQKFVILVKDNGQPSRSATVTLNMVFAENVQEALPELSNQPQDSENQSGLEIYLVVALALISLLFILAVMFVVAIKCRQAKEQQMLNSLRPALYSQVDPKLATNYQNGTLPLPYSYEIGVALNSHTNEFAFLKPSQAVSTDILFTANDSGIGVESLGGTADVGTLEKVRNVS